MKKLKQHFPKFWREFLLISIEPTKAATNALKCISGMENMASELAQHQNELDRLEKCLIGPLVQNTAYRHDPDLVTAVERNLSDFFSNFYVLNKCFTRSPVTPQSAGFDDLKAAAFFSRLCYIVDHCMSPEASEAALKSIHSSFKKVFQSLQACLAINPLCFVDAVQLRFFLLLMGSSLFQTFAFHFEDILSDVYRMVMQLPAAAQDIMKVWFEHVHVSTLDRCVAIAHQRIVLSIMSCTDGVQALKESQSQILADAFGALKMLFESNRRRQIFLNTSLAREALTWSELDEQSAYCTPLDISKFYNDAINAADILIRWDFFQWKQNQPLDFNLVGNTFLLDVATKAWYFSKHSLMTQGMSSWEPLMGHRGIHELVTLHHPYLVLNVRRSDLVYDALRSLTTRSAEGALSKQLRVVFANEEAVDEGGVTKEFFQLLVEQLFNPDYGMFTYDQEKHIFWFSPNTFEHNLQFELIGVVLGLAIYNGVILDMHFPLVVYKKLLEYPVGLRDLGELEPETERSLRQILLMSEEDLQAADLTFSKDVVQFDETKTIQLSPDYPADTPVTIQNREQFVLAYVDWILNESIKQQFTAFHRGFMKCCGKEIKSLGFEPQELLLVICGSNDFDTESLEAATQYKDGYTANDQTVRDFWEIVHQLSKEDKKRLLFFVTGSDRIPVKGISSLQFLIGRAGADTEKIPTAHTCYNFLLLPDYKDKQKLEKFLRIALEHHKGFGLR